MKGFILGIILLATPMGRGITQTGLPVGDEIDVPCELRKRGDGLNLVLKNSYPDPISIYLGTGSPMFYVGQESPGLLTLEASFSCPFEYVHECFHAEGLDLPAGSKKEIYLNNDTSKLLLFIGKKKQIPCLYRTRRSRSETQLNKGI